MLKDNNSCITVNTLERPKKKIMIQMMTTLHFQTIFVFVFFWHCSSFNIVLGLRPNHIMLSLQQFILRVWTMLIKYLQVACALWRNPSSKSDCLSPLQLPALSPQNLKFKPENHAKKGLSGTCKTRLPLLKKVEQNQF